MRILILDDDSKRAQALKKHICESVQIDASSVDLADCVDSGKLFLRAVYYDALILDVVLPKRKDERPSSLIGLQLLDQLHRSPTLNKPEKLVGITAHLDDISAFRQQFDEHCTAIIEAQTGTVEWRDRIVRTLSYTASSKIGRHALEAGSVVLTVHGIQTYGSWQSRFRSAIEKKTKAVSFLNYKYGYFSALLLLIPYFRNQEIAKLERHFRTVVNEVGAKRVFVFAHSFGTFLVVHAMRNLLTTTQLKAHVVIVLCGSVLREDFDWSFLYENKNVYIVNDCGSRDYILWLSATIVPGLGMAGKAGFKGFNSSRFVNRYFDGGHSHYFEGEDFMSKFWIPIIEGDSSVITDLDKRSQPSFVHALVESAVLLFCRFKKPSISLLLALLALLVYGVAW